MATYDDESYVMMTIKTFLDGDRLYAEMFTQYGSAYFMIPQAIHGIMGVPITHDVVRLKIEAFSRLEQTTILRLPVPFGSSLMVVARP